jgi:hypothetical protein
MQPVGERLCINIPRYYRYDPLIVHFEYIGIELPDNSAGGHQFSFYPRLPQRHICIDWPQQCTTKVIFRL